MSVSATHSGPVTSMAKGPGLARAMGQGSAFATPLDLTTDWDWEKAKASRSATADGDTLGEGLGVGPGVGGLLRFCGLLGVSKSEIVEVIASILRAAARATRSAFVALIRIAREWRYIPFFES